MKIKWLLAICFTCLCAAFSDTVYAEDAPYSTYTYDHFNNEQASPNGYTVKTVLTGKEISGEAFLNPRDFFISNNEMFVLDSGNSRVAVLDLALKMKRFINFVDADGKAIVFENATGIFVSDIGEIYIADAKKECVYRASNDGHVQFTYTKPNIATYDQKITFAASKIVVDKSGNIYILVDGLYTGAVIYSRNGDFLGYYGANEVQMTLTMLADQQWRKLLNRDQIAAMSRFVPTAYSGFDIDNEDFIYTCSKSGDSNRVRKLNPAGNGLWDAKKLLFGDVSAETDQVKSLLTDVDISSESYLNVLDSGKGRVFQYNQSGHLLFAFGGMGTQKGNFTEPVAIESNGEDIYVLDAKTTSITLFQATEYGQLMHEAAKLFDKGEYAKAKTYWEKVLERNTNSEFANLGLGKAYFQANDSKEALKYLKWSNDRVQYSNVFSQYRVSFIRTNFYWIALAVVLFIIAYRLIVKKDILRIGKYMVNVRRHLRVMLHPADAFLDIVEHKWYSYIFAVLVIAYWFILSIVQYFAKGFIFNFNLPQGFNLLFVFVSTALAYVLWTVANWAVSTLLEGKGSMKAIFCSCAYALLPYLLAQTINLVLTQVFTLDETAFMTWIAMAGILWSILILINVLMTMHQYTLGKTVANILLTIFGIAVILFLLFMAVVLFDHVSNLFITVYNELTLRH